MALRSSVCDVPEPTELDAFKAPRFATPTSGKLIYADPSAASGGDGSKTKPFRSLDAAVAAAATPGPKTILLRAGRYHTAGVVLTPSHSDLTIQNEDGAQVVVSGAVPVANSKGKWSVHDKATNTWKLDTAGQNLPTEFGMRVGTKRAIRAKYPNGDPETAPAYCIIPLGSIASPGVYLNGSGVSEQYPQYFPRVHAPRDAQGDAEGTQEFWAHPRDWPGTFWHDAAPNSHPQSIGGYGPFFYAAGGVCAGRTPSHGYWCSSHNPRSSVGCTRAAGSDGGQGGLGCHQHSECSNGRLGLQLLPF